MTINRFFPENPGFIESRGPSAYHVQQAMKRFSIVNDGRLARLRQGLQPKQQQCFDLLPLLFHLNQESLPGFMPDTTVPYGLSNYYPDEIVFRQAYHLTRGKVPHRVTHHKPQLAALYLMGSSGSIGQSSASDLDIWVCHYSDLSESDIQALAEKAERITQWANDFNLEVHFFIMDAHNFRGTEQPSLTGENSGSAQQVLLLDEFYRTAQVLAGNPPVWWFIPTCTETEYQATLSTYYSENLISQSHCTNFGGITTLSPGEFIGAGMWQIYKAIDSPYKSILKLILLEIYAREFPNIDSLAHRYKNSIYDMHLSLDDLDPYVMLYRRIEQYLLDRGDVQRLDLIRRCFYLKVGIKVSKTVRHSTWRRDLMTQLVQSWGWTNDTISHLDNFKLWSVDEVMEQQRLLVNELNHSFRFFTEFNADHHSAHMISQRDLLVLSRKLHTAFDRRPGKIDFINIGLDIDLSHEQIRFYERESTPEPGVFLWAAYNQSLDDDDTITPLKYSKGLIETLLWVHLNGLISSHLQIPIYPINDKITEIELRKTLASMRQHLPLPLPKVDSTRYYEPAIITKVVLFINLGMDPFENLSSLGLHKITDQTNSFEFSSKQQNLVLSIDAIIVNSWGEVVIERYTDEAAVTRSLKSFINRLNKQPEAQPPIIETVCHGQNRSQAIAQRVKTLFRDAMTALCNHNQANNTRFLFNVGGQFIIFQQQNRVTKYTTIRNRSALLLHLSSAQESYSLMKFDRFVTEDTAILASLFEKHQPDSVTVAFETQKKTVNFYVIDEHGSLISFSQSFISLSTLLAPLIRFIKTTEHRQRNREDIHSAPQRPIRCFQINRLKKEAIFNKVILSGLINKGNFISIQANVDLTEDRQYEYYVVCNGEEFSTAELGSDMYSAIAAYIIDHRPSGSRYPTYITDLVLTEAVIEDLPFGYDQTSQYLKIKLSVEEKINEAMSML